MGEFEAMSYADATKEHRLPEGQQPHPDPSLLEGHNQPSEEVEKHDPGVDEKVSVVTQDVKQEIEREEEHAEEIAEKDSQKFKRKIQEIEGAADKDAKRGKAEAKALDNRLHKSFKENPKLWAGAASIVNIASLAAAGYLAYANWNKPRWDRRIVAAVAAGLATLFAPQGAFATAEAKRK